MNIKNFFDITLKKPVCIEGISEDAIRELINALEISVTDDEFTSFVVSTAGTKVKFNFGPDGNFNNVTADINSQKIVLFEGVTGSQLGVFKGSPTATNPGTGWQVEVDLTRKYLNQPINENDWEMFLASRVGIINI